MFGKFGSLLSFTGHSIGRLGAIPKRRRSGGLQASTVAASSETLECRTLLSITPGPNINVSQATGNQISPQLAVNPLNPNEIVIVSDSGTNGTGDLQFYISEDGGVSWEQKPLGINQDNTGFSSSTRINGSVAFDGYGNIHVAYVVEDFIYDKFVYAFSSDGGDSFTTQSYYDDNDFSFIIPRPRVTVGPSSATSTIDNQVWITFESSSDIGFGNTTYLYPTGFTALTAKILGKGSFPVFSTPSTPFGSTIQSNSFYSPQYFVFPAVDPNGGISTVRQLALSQNQNSSSVLLNSDANGAVNGVSFGTDRTVVSTNSGITENYAANTGSSYFGSSAQIAYDLSNGPHRGRLYLVYVDENPDESDNSDVYLRYSDNNGATFSQRILINDDATSRSQFLPSLSVDPILGTVVVGWYDARNDTGSGGIDTDFTPNSEVQYYLAASSDGGVTFSPNVLVSGGATRENRSFFFDGLGTQTTVKAFDGDAYVAWSDNSNSTLDNPNPSGNYASAFDIYFSKVSIDPNLPPVVSAVSDIVLNEDTVSSPLDFTIGDSRTAADGLLVTATSSNPLLIPNDHLILTGTGANRHITVSPLANRSGVATITISVSDGRFTTETTFKVTVLPTPDVFPAVPDVVTTTTPFTQPTSTAIVDNTTITSTLAVSGLGSYLIDANVLVNISHTRNSDLNVVLISPQGTRVTLTSGNGGTADNVFAGTLFDDQAVSTPVTDFAFQNNVLAAYLVPEGALAQLSLEDPNGTWTLEITDTLTGETGMLNSWGLDLTTSATMPQLQSFPTGSSSQSAAIPDDGSPLLSTIQFNGLDFFIWDVTLNLNISHPRTGDLDIYLISPEGLEVPISTGNGAAFANVFQFPTTFSDQGSVPVTDSPFSDNTPIGVVIPEGALSGFVGQNPNGTWTLKVIDHAPGQTGLLVDWSLDITTTFVNDQPTISAIPNPGAIPEDSPTQSVQILGLSAGGGEDQPLAVTVTSNNPGLLQDLKIDPAYISPSNHATVTYTPTPNAFGVAVVTVRVEDGGFDKNLLTTADNAFTERQFTIVVNPINDAPTLDPIVNPPAILEDAAQQSLTLTGITSGAGENQPLSIKVNSNHPEIISNPFVDYVDGATTAVVKYKSNLNYNGDVTLTVVVTDGGLDNNLATTADNLTVTRSFVVSIIPVNDPPTLDVINDTLPISEDSPPQTIGLTGISAGGSETQPLRITATSSDPSLVQNLLINYTSPNSVGSLTFRPAPNAFGTATITVTIEDGGGDADLSTSGDNQTFQRQFVITVLEVNDPPVFDSLGNAVILSEDAGPQTVNLTGIYAGPFESQPLVFDVTSSNPALIPTPTITYTSPNTTGTLNYTVTPNMSGGSVLTVTLMDGGQDGNLSTLADNQIFIRTLVVSVLAVNDPPTLNNISNPPAIDEDTQTSTIVNFSGVSAGSGETQPLMVVATSNLPAIISDPVVTYTSGSPTGSLSFKPNPNQYGTVVISVTVYDGGLDNDLSTTADNGSVVKTFTVTVNPINDAPSFNTISNPAPIMENAGLQTVTVTGISAGPNETQALEITAVSNDPTVLPDPSVTYTQGASTATLTYTPVSGKSGVVQVTVKVTDPGPDNDFLTINDNLSYEQTFTVVINSVNEVPTINSLATTVTLDEDAPLQTVNLTGLSAGNGDAGQSFVVTASTDNPTLFPTLTILHSLGSSTGSLTYAPAANQSGTGTITVTVTDGGMDNNLATTEDNLTTSTSFVVIVNPVNDFPTLNSLGGEYDISEDAGLQTINLTGITAGGGESQPLSVTVESLNTDLIFNPQITYTSPNTTGVLTFAPLAEQFGSAILRIRIEDGGPDGNLATTGDNKVTIQDLLVNVGEVDDAPTIDVIPSPISINENSEPTTVGLTGISAGPGEVQTLTITAVSDNPSLIADPTVIYIDGLATASLTFTPQPNQSGVAHITVTVEDSGNNQTVRVLTVNVNPVNDPPTIDSLGGPLTIDEDAPAQTVLLTGLSAGSGEPGQVFDVKVTSNHPEIIPNPTLVYTPGQSTGSFIFQPLPDANGQVTLTVRVTDGGDDNNLATTGDNRTKEVQLVVNVTPQPETPSLTIDQGTLQSLSGRPVFAVPQAQLKDGDSPNYKNGSLKFELFSVVNVNGVPTEVPPQSGDQLKLVAFGSGSSRISATSSGQLKRGRDVIGTITGGKNGVPLTITFTADIDLSSVQQVIRNIQYRGQARQTGLRHLKITVKDEAARTSTPVTRAIAVN